MPTPISLLGLPASLLLLIAAQVTNVHASTQPLPTAIRKMGTDAGEKFLQEYSAFGDNDEVSVIGSRADLAVSARGVLTPEEEELLAANSSALITYRAPFAAHFYGHVDARAISDGWDLFRRARLVEARLAKRDFACPTGTSDCSTISYPDSCCQSGTTCVKIEDTGLGPVGCCPDGESCGGTIACSGDQQGCSSSSGGGCCIPGYECASIGCTESQTATVTVVTQTSTSISHTVTTDTTTSTTTPSRTSTTVTSTQTTTGDASAPVRPTSGSTSTSSSASASATNSGYCPTGFYACSAVYGGGCCQTGRDCHTTSCPTTASTTIISNGVTVVVPATDVPSTTTDATCANGWSVCPSSAGPTAGCCPSGYSCGTASCFLATGSATASVAKELPGSGAARNGDIMWYMTIIPTLLGFAFRMAGI